VRIRAATRGSALARWQVDRLAELLATVLPDVTLEPVVVETAGDRDQVTPLDEMGGQGVFVKEVQAAVLDGRADVAVHSAKDLPAATPDGLVLAAVPERADARDALVGCRWADLGSGATVATGSIRRRAHLSHLRPDLAFSGLRGNIETRLSKAEGVDAVVVAAAALEAAGATVETTSVPSTLYGLSAYYVIAPAEASSNLARYDGVRFGLRVDAPNSGDMHTATRTAGFGDEVKRRIMLGTYALSAGYYDAYYGKSQKVRTLIVNDFAMAYGTYDLLLSPTAPTTAFPIGEKTADPMTMYLNDVCTIPSNLAGHPSMSVPFGVGDDGMPVGVQVLAPAMGEPAMFRAAAVLEAAAPPGASS